MQARAADITVPDMISVDLGGRIVEVRHFGFAQTPGDLVIWAPDAKVLWVGNMIQAPSPALPWLLEGRHKETMATLARVRDFLPARASARCWIDHRADDDDLDDAGGAVVNGRTGSRLKSTTGDLNGRFAAPATLGSHPRR